MSRPKSIAYMDTIQECDTIHDPATQMLSCIMWLMRQQREVQSQMILWLQLAYKGYLHGWQGI